MCVHVYSCSPIPIPYDIRWSLLCGPIPTHTHYAHTLPLIYESLTHTHARTFTLTHTHTHTHTSHAHRTFEWLDDRKVSKKMTKVPAKQFIDTALSQIQKQLRDETIFPTKFGQCTDNAVRYIPLY